MNKRLVMTLLFTIIGISDTAHSHYTPMQNTLAEQGLEQITPKLTTHINTLDYVATDLRNLISDIPDELQASKAWVALEIIENHSMRAWYNRLLLQNILIIKDAVNLGQMSTILKLSKEPLSNGIHRLNVIYGQTKDSEQRRLYENARDSLYSILAVYDEALAALKEAMAHRDSSQ